MARVLLFGVFAVVLGNGAMAQAPREGGAGVVGGIPLPRLPAAAPEALPPLPALPAASADILPPLPATAAITPDAEAGRSGAVSGNPAAVNILSGSGWLGDRLGVNRNGFRVGGLNIADANGLLSGGLAPGRWTGDTLTIFDLSVNTEEALGWKGGLFGSQFLYYSGGPMNRDAGTVMGYNSLDGASPQSRAELYQLWYRQELLDKRLIIRIGKSVPTYDFNNVVRSAPVGNAAYDIPAVSSAILTPLYVSPTQLGIMPGYYNSATGMVATFLPTKRTYIQYGLFDGNLAAGRQTGLEGPHFNGYALHLGEVGLNWILKESGRPGAFGVGGWRQTGVLQAPSGPVQGAQGFYLFGSQRLYYERPGETKDGLSFYYQFASTNSDFVFVHRYFGCGLSYYGLLPGRDQDSAGFGLAYGRMNSDPRAGSAFFPPPANDPTALRPLGKSELIFSWYYQMQLANNFYVQPNLSFIPDPAQRPGIPEAFAFTLRAIVLF